MAEQARRNCNQKKIKLLIKKFFKNEHQLLTPNPLLQMQWRVFLFINVAENF